MYIFIFTVSLVRFVICLNVSYCQHRRVINCCHCVPCDTELHCLKIIKNILLTHTVMHLVTCPLITMHKGTIVYFEPHCPSAAAVKTHFSTVY